MNKNKLKLEPELRFPEFRDSEKWEIKRLSSFIRLFRGSSPRPINNYLTKDKDGVNWIKIGDTKHATNFKISKVEEKITVKGSKKSRRVHRGELILANSMSYKKEKRQNILRTGDIDRGEINDIYEIINTYKNRPEKVERYSRRVSMDEIKKNDYNLNISRYVSTAKPEEKIDLTAVNKKLAEIDKAAFKALNEHNKYLRELGLKTI